MLLFICKREEIHGDDLLDIDGVSNSETGIDERNFTFVYDIIRNVLLEPTNSYLISHDISVDNNDIITATTGSNVLSVTADGYNSEGIHEGKDQIMGATDYESVYETGNFAFDAQLKFKVEVV